MNPEDRELSAEIKHSMISSRTKEPLTRKKSEGKQLGRPKGSFATATKLTGKEQIIRELLEKRVSHSAIARTLGVNRGTLTSYVKRHQLDRPPSSLSKSSLDHCLNGRTYSASTYAGRASWRGNTLEYPIRLALFVIAAALGVGVLARGLSR